MRMSSFRGSFIAILIATLIGGCVTSPPEPSPPEPPRSETAYYTQCNGEVKDLAAIVAPIVDSMVSQAIPYPSYGSSREYANQWRDCSGNFLRLTSYVAGACSEHSSGLVAPSGIDDYNPNRSNVVSLDAGARTTRGIAKWFYEEPTFIFQPIYYDDVPATPRKQAISADLLKYRHFIRPGSVLWFARTMPTSDHGLTALFEFNGETSRHINHMGTVTAVRHDADGQVISFSMYHGRNPDKGAGVTDHEWAYSGTSDYPPFGVGKQYLVGIGVIVPVSAGIGR
jgi:hypothetical protein